LALIGVSVYASSKTPTWVSVVVGLTAGYVKRSGLLGSMGRKKRAKT
jgi:hypothetical protein